VKKKSQMGFIDFIVKPTYEAMSIALVRNPSLEPFFACPSPSLLFKHLRIVGSSLIITASRGPRHAANFGGEQREMVKAT